MLSCDAKLKSQAPVARISKPMMLNGVGMSRCETASTNETSPPGLRITSTTSASVFVIEERDLLIQLLQHEGCARRRHRRNPQQADPLALPPCKCR